MIINVKLLKLLTFQMKEHLVQLLQTLIMLLFGIRRLKDMKNKQYESFIINVII